MRTVTIAPYSYQFYYNEFSCKFSLNVSLGGCKVIENQQLCLGTTEIVDNVSITIIDDQIDNVTVQRINNVIDEISEKKYLLFG